jgi:menaquinone-dependent protoporphyrinogen oxidase
MRVLIIYATTEGHTRDLGHYLMRTLDADGHHVAVEEAPLGAPYPDPGAYDAVFVAGSLHVGRYQTGLTAFVQSRLAELSATPSAFISVSLSAAGLNPDDWEGLDTCLDRFQHQTGWAPAAVHQAAGSIRYSQHDFFKRLVIQHIVARRGQAPATSHHHDLTDYGKLSSFCRDFLASVKPPPR